jgi:ribosomal protein L37E
MKGGFEMRKEKKVIFCDDCGRPIYEEDAYACFACYRPYLCESCMLEHDYWHKLQAEAREKK